MPTVPVYSDFQATPTTTPDVAVQAPQDNDITAQQYQQLGGALEGAGQQIGAIYNDMAQKANQTRATDNTNQLSEYILQQLHDPNTGYLNTQGYDALKPNSDGQAPSDSVIQNIQQKITDLSSGLSNDQQKQMFANTSSNLLLSAQQQVMEHQATQGKVYHNSVQDGQIAINAQTMALNPDDPNIVAQSVANIRNAQVAKDQMNGVSPVQTVANQQIVASPYLRNVVQQQINQGNLTGANNFMKQWGSSMAPDDALAINSVLQKSNNNATGFRYAQKYSQASINAANPSPMQSMVQITQVGGNKGAFDPDAQQDISFDIPAQNGGQAIHARYQNVTYNQALQQIQHDLPADQQPDAIAGLNQWRDSHPNNPSVALPSLMQTYANNAPLAWAAFHDGTTEVNNAIAQAKKTGANPISLLPQETQSYVAKNMAALNKAASTSPSDVPTQTFEQGQQQMIAEMQANGESQESIDKAVSYSNNFNSVHQQEIKRQSEEQQANVTNAIVAAGGDLSKVDPTITSGMDADDLAKSVTTSGTILNGTQFDNPHTLMQVSNDQTLAKMTPAQVQALVTSLKPATFASTVKRYQALQNGSDDSPAIVNDTMFTRSLNSQLALSGLFMNHGSYRGAPIDPAQDSRYQAVYATIKQEIATQQAHTGKQINSSTDMDNLIGRALGSVIYTHSHTHYLLTGGDSTDTATPVRLFGMTPNDIPDVQLNAIKKSFAARGNSNPSDGQIMGSFFHMMGK